MEYSTLKLWYKDLLGTFTSAILQVTDSLDVLNLDDLPMDLQQGIIEGNYNKELLNLDGGLSL